MNSKHYVLAAAVALVALGIAVVAESTSTPTPAPPQPVSSTPAPAAPVERAIASSIAPTPAPAATQPTEAPAAVPSPEGVKVTNHPDGSKTIDGLKMIRRFPDGRVEELNVKAHAKPTMRPIDSVMKRQSRVKPKAVDPSQNVPAPPSEATPPAEGIQPVPPEKS